MGQIRLGREEDLVVELRRSARARRISLRVSTLDGRVTLTVPRHVDPEVARAFAEEKSTWIRKALERQKPVVPVVAGAEVPVEGHMYPVLAGSGRKARLTQHGLEAPEGRAGPAVQAFLKGLARERLVTATEKHARTLGRSFRRITLRDTRSRWGSCSHEGNLMYSWRLIMAPREVLDYVAAHEVAHLAHMDHSRAFWDTVEGLCPDYAGPRLWLRRDGAGLHGYQFSSVD